MPRFIVIILLGSLAWYGYAKYRTKLPRVEYVSSPAPTSKPLLRQANVPEPSSQFKCDGRTYCSQMTSCAEATYFLKNCPGTKMDGDNDGVPCEQQLCTSPFAD